MASVTMPVGALVVCIVAPFVLCAFVVGVFYYCCCRRRLNWYERTFLEYDTCARQSSEENHLCDTPALSVATKTSRGAQQVPAIIVGPVPHRVIKVRSRNNSSSMGSTSSSLEDSDPGFDTRRVVPRQKKRTAVKRACASANKDPQSTSATSMESTGSHRKDSLSPLPSKPRRESASLSVASGERPNMSDILPAGASKKRTQSLAPGMGLFQAITDLRLGLPRGQGSSSLPTLGPAASPTVSTDILSEHVTMVQTSTNRGRRLSMQDALDPALINATMYDNKDTPEQESRGSLNWSLAYSPEQGLLTVRVIQARNIVPKSCTGTADPYCKLCLLPNKNLKLQTRVHKCTCNPVFGEEFLFDVAQSDLVSRTVEITVYDFDQYSRDAPLGQVVFPLENVDLNQSLNLWLNLTPCDSQQKNNGDLMLSMSYLPAAERLTIHVLKARGLESEDARNVPSCYVKVLLFVQNKRLKKKKTQTIRSNCNPVWNEALTFDVAKHLLKQLRVEFTIYSDSILGNKGVLGAVTIGPNSSGDELKHWEELNNWKSAARWHQLSNKACA